MQKQICILIAAAALSACASAQSTTASNSTGSMWVTVGDAAPYRTASNDVPSSRAPKRVYWFLASR